ncbi:alkylated DNA repair protein alkB 1 [Cadophora sp. MPI-SDFR-AT-0126]|nr:alkylated DNA repair protein alkB 1 [Leotiomycetes sp. MPI-SDFR-AT-0126]
MANETEVPKVQPGELAPHEPVPQMMKDAFKSWKGRNMTTKQLHAEGITDLAIVGVKRSDISIDTLFKASQSFQASQGLDVEPVIFSTDISEYHTIDSYSIPSIPGLTVIPSLLSPAVQQRMLSTLFHRDLSDGNHKTNLHLHYNVRYPGTQSSEDADGPSRFSEESHSFFGDNPDRVAFVPKTPNEHKPVTVRAALKKKLRWMTLGGQYDWTAKAYPKEAPPPFPPDIASFIHKLFPTMKPQAAIVNVYSPGDTLSMHRDVSEKVDRGLVSISIGCDAIFIIGLADDGRPPVCEVLRLRSGDAVYMTGQSRLAWHGVASILPGTCPDYLEEWPGEEYPEWRRWMKDKRINLNIRQMFDDENENRKD